LVTPKNYETQPFPALQKYFNTKSKQIDQAVKSKILIQLRWRMTTMLRPQADLSGQQKTLVPGSRRIRVDRMS